LAKKKALQREIEGLSQSRRSREEIIEQLRIRYEQTESQIEDRARDVRRTRKQQRHEIEKLRLEIAEARQAEKDYKQRLEELRLADFKDQEEWKRNQEALEEYRVTLKSKHHNLHTQTEAAVIKLREAEALLADLSNKEVALRQRAKLAAEELQRQHNEALRCKQTLDEKRRTLALLREKVVLLRAARKERKYNPGISAIQIPPRAEPSTGTNDIASDFGVVHPSPDIFALSPINSEMDGDAAVLQLKEEVSKARRMSEGFVEHLAQKRTEIAAIKADGSEYETLKKENERLRAQAAEMEIMKQEISKFRQGKLAI
jgi:hypothetical protein